MSAVFYCLLNRTVFERGHKHNYVVFVLVVFCSLFRVRNYEGTWYLAVRWPLASQLLNLRLGECCKQLKRPVAVIPHCRYPRNPAHWRPQECPHSLLLCASNFLLPLVSLSFIESFSFSFCPSFGIRQGEAPEPFASPPVSPSPMHTHPSVVRTDATVCH